MTKWQEKYLSGVCNRMYKKIPAEDAVALHLIIKAWLSEDNSYHDEARAMLEAYEVGRARK